MERLPTFDLLRMDAYDQGTPHEVFDALRRLKPVYFHPPHYGGSADVGGRTNQTTDGTWCITKFADIALVGNDPRRFSSTVGTGLYRTPEGDAMKDLVITSMDPPKHTRVHRALQQAFTPKRVAAAQPIISHFIDRAIDSVIEAGEADIFKVAASLPISMIARLMGLPDEMHSQILEWTNRTFGADDPDYAASPEVTACAFKDIRAYGLEVAAQRRAAPGDDLVSALVTAEVDGAPLNDDEISWNFFLVMGAGNDTTRTLILNAVNLLLDHPQAWAELRADRSLIRNAIDEVLRVEPSVRGMGRTAREDVVIRGETIRKGDHVFMWYVSGNRDEEVFDDPHRFDIRRQNANRHQAFGGGGPHYCIGAPLARLQAQLILDRILDRMPDIARAGPAKRARSTGFMNSLKSLPVRFTPGPVVRPAALQA